MKFMDFIIMLFLFLLLGFGLYILWMNLPSEPTAFESYSSNETNSLPIISKQFYPNMRFEDKQITYSIGSACSNIKKENIEEALAILSDNTVLRFSITTISPGIKFLCSDIAPTDEEKRHFVAGEGGPTEIINTTKYSVILSSRVSLYRDEICDEPKVSLHEILHALGFDHSSNKMSIMYPVTDCSQQLDDSIVEDINKIYSVDSLIDLSIERVTANTTGRYLNFEITVANLGLKKSDSPVLNVYGDDNLIKEFDIDEIDIGTRKFLSVENLRTSTNIQSVKFSIKDKSDSQELSLDNNVIILSVK